MAEKTTGIVRRLDELGRICIPKEIRTSLGLTFYTPVEITIQDDAIVIKRHQNSVLSERVKELQALFDNTDMKADTGLTWEEIEEIEQLLKKLAKMIPEA